MATPSAPTTARAGATADTIRSIESRFSLNQPAASCNAGTSRLRNQSTASSTAGTSHSANLWPNSSAAGVADRSACRIAASAWTACPFWPNSGPRNDSPSRAIPVSTFCAAPRVDEPIAWAAPSNRSVAAMASMSVSNVTSPADTISFSSSVVTPIASARMLRIGMPCRARKFRSVAYTRPVAATRRNVSAVRDRSFSSVCDVTLAMLRRSPSTSSRDRPVASSWAAMLKPWGLANGVPSNVRSTPFMIWSISAIDRPICWNAIVASSVSSTRRSPPTSAPVMAATPAAAATLNAVVTVDTIRSPTCSSPCTALAARLDANPRPPAIPACAVTCSSGAPTSRRT